MSIEWEEVGVGDSSPAAGAEQVMHGRGDSGETYLVWYGPTFLDPDTPEKHWVAYGWPEADKDDLPSFDSYPEAVALCERWEEIKSNAEGLARSAFTGLRTRQPTVNYRSIGENELHRITSNSVLHTFDLVAAALIAFGLSRRGLDLIASHMMDKLSESFDGYSGLTRVEVLRLLNSLSKAFKTVDTA